jgi:hypothetical protein
MLKKIKAFFRDLKIAYQEREYLPLVLTPNHSDTVEGEMGELSIIKNKHIPTLVGSLLPYLLPTVFKQDTHLIRYRPYTMREDPNETWFFINGILTSPKVASINAKYLSHVFGRPINVIYNPTEGFGKDMAECILGRTFNHKSKVSDLAVACIKPVLEAGKKVKLIGHSQGGIISSNVLCTLKSSGLTDEQLSNLEVFTFAGAQDEMVEHPGVSEHFANEKDYVARVGVIRLDSNIAGKTWIRYHATGHLLNEHYIEAFRRGMYCGGESQLFKYLNS